MEYENNSKLFRYELQKMNSYDSSRSILCGQCVTTFEKGIFYISIEIPTQELISEIFKERDNYFKVAMKDFICGHEEAHACTLSGNSMQLLNLITKYLKIPKAKFNINLIKKFDKEQKKRFDSKSGKIMEFSKGFRELLSNEGGLIALIRNDTPLEIADEITRLFTKPDLLNQTKARASYQSNS